MYRKLVSGFLIVCLIISIMGCAKNNNEEPVNLVEVEPIVSEEPVQESKLDEVKEPVKEEPIKEEEKVLDLSVDDETVSFECNTQYTLSTTTFTKKGDAYSVEYIAVTHDDYKEYADTFDEGPFGGEIDKETYDRAIAIINYVSNNTDEFNDKARKYSQLDYANPTSDLLLDFAFSTLALSVDKQNVEDSEYMSREAKYHLDDIEQIINHVDFVDQYYVYTDIASSGGKEEGYLHDYYNDADTRLRIVDYSTYVDTWNYYTKNEPLKFDDKDKEYAILADLGFSSWVDLWVDELVIEDNKLIVSLYNDHNGVMADGGGAFLVIPVPKGTEIGDVVIAGPSYKEDPNYEPTEDKPVIYLYNYDGDVNVTVKADFTCTYPKYEQNGWSVKATPNGTLYDKDGKAYRYLFWEGNSDYAWNMDKGFCVKGVDTAYFLEEKLEQIGLNADEINEFIIYWLPQMEQNPYNVITFQTIDYDKVHPLVVTPKPESLLRVFMTWYSSNNYVDLEEQVLSSFDRKGRTVIEWGGSRVK